MRNADREGSAIQSLGLFPAPTPRSSAEWILLLSLVIYDPAVGLESQLLKVQQVRCEGLDKEWPYAVVPLWATAAALPVLCSSYLNPK